MVHIVEMQEEIRGYAGKDSKKKRKITYALEISVVFQFCFGFLLSLFGLAGLPAAFFGGAKLFGLGLGQTFSAIPGILAIRYNSSTRIWIGFFLLQILMSGCQLAWFIYYVASSEADGWLAALYFCLFAFQLWLGIAAILHTRISSFTQLMSEFQEVDDSMIHKRHTPARKTKSMSSTFSSAVEKKDSQTSSIKGGKKRSKKAVSSSKSKSKTNSKKKSQKSKDAKKKKESPPPKMDPNFEKKLDEWRERNVKAIENSKNKKRRAPAWDEVEMRRHGLIDRHCDRKYLNEIPSNPASVDVSVYNSAPLTQSSSQTSPAPPLHSSMYSSVPPAASVPASVYAESGLNDTVKAGAASAAENKKGRAPAWDEVEMRRHGLINRHCDRKLPSQIPSNPASVDVSVCNSSPLSQGSIHCSPPPDSSSMYSSFSAPNPSSVYVEPGLNASVKAV